MISEGEEGMIIYRIRRVMRVGGEKRSHGGVRLLHATIPYYSTVTTHYYQA